jgi:hypothetical protein
MSFRPAGEIFQILNRSDFSSQMLLEMTKFKTLA